MNEIIACCGLVCHTCPIYLAAREPDPSRKETMLNEIIKMGKEYYGVEFKLEEITECDGCMSDTGRLYFRCKDCQIRNCAKDKDLSSCACCDEYPCDKLAGIFKADTEAKSRLDLRRGKF